VSSAAAQPARAPISGANERTPLYQIMALGMSGVPLASIVLVFGLFLPRYYVTLGSSFAAVSVAILVVRLLDIALDPGIGMLMDQTRTPIGRYRPWLLLGAPILMFGTWKVLIPGEHVTQLYLIGWLLFTYVGNSMLTLGLAAWGANVAGAYHERARLFGVTQSMTVVGINLLLLLGLLTHGKIQPGTAASMPIITKIMVIAIPITVLITVFLTPERKLAGVTKSKFALADYVIALKRGSMLRLILADLVLTLGAGATGPIFVYFFHDAKGFSIAMTSTLLVFYIGAGLIGAPTWSWLAQKATKHRAVQIACVAYAICQTILMAIPKGLYLPTAAGMFAVGFCASAFIPLVRSMVADVCDEVRLETGKDLSSVIYSMVTTTMKVGAALVVVIILPVLQMVGYNGKEGAVNTPHAIFGLEMCYLFAPIVLVFIGGGTLFGYKLDAKRHAEIRAGLEAREVAAAAEPITGEVIPSPVAAE
jgi:GPH family glycoside/pentoside/hexuronide:cation symporter